MIAALAVVAAALTALITTVRLAGERRARVEAELRIAALHEKLAEAEGALLDLGAQQRNWVAVFSHELRSPIAAILGYGELLADGLLGNLDEPGQDAIVRINHAAGQILRLTEGVEQMAIDPVADSDLPEQVSTRELLAAAADALRFDAEARGTTITVNGGEYHLTTRRENAARALTLALGAAVKATPGGTLRLSATGHPSAPCFIIAGTRLDPAVDDPTDADTRLTGAGFRIALARLAAAAAGGTLVLMPSAGGAELHLELPPLD